jgi:hypothetical protein
MGKKRLRAFKPTQKQLKALKDGRERSMLYRAGRTRHEEKQREKAKRLSVKGP